MPSGWNGSSLARSTKSKSSGTFASVWTGRSLFFFVLSTMGRTIVVARLLYTPRFVDATSLAGLRLSNQGAHRLLHAGSPPHDGQSLEYRRFLSLGENEVGIFSWYGAIYGAICLVLVSVRKEVALDELFVILLAAAALAATLGCRTHFRLVNRCRRLAKDFENLTRNALAFLRLASIRLTLRKLCLN